MSGLGSSISDSIKRAKKRKRADDSIPGVEGDDTITPDNNAVDEDRATPSPIPDANPDSVTDKAKEEEDDSPWAFKRIRGLFKGSK